MIKIYVTSVKRQLDNLVLCIKNIHTDEEERSTICQFTLELGILLGDNEIEIVTDDNYIDTVNKSSYYSSVSYLLSRSRSEFLTTPILRLISLYTNFLKKNGGVI